MKRILIFLIAWVFIANAQGTLDTTAGWQYRFPITIQASMVDADLDSFPFYFPLDSSLAAFWGNVNVDGSDIRITKSDKVTLCFAQLDTFNFSKADSAGELYWRGDASSTTDTKFYLYYGYSGAVADWSNQVWNEQYAAVYHFSENPANGSLQDWTANGNNGTAQGGMDAADLVDGKIGTSSAWDFDGINDFVDAGATPKIPATGNFTILAVYNQATSTNDMELFGQYLRASDNGRFLLRVTPTNVPTAFLGNNPPVPTVSIFDTFGRSGWVDFSLSRDSNTFNLRTNGVQRASHTDGSTRSILQTGNLIGARSDATDYSIAFDNYYKGLIDELRVLHKATNENNTLSQYNNLFSPAIFAIAGEIEAVNVQSNNNNPKKKSRYKGFGTGFKGGWRK